MDILSIYLVLGMVVGIARGLMHVGNDIVKHSIFGIGTLPTAIVESLFIVIVLTLVWPLYIVVTLILYDFEDKFIKSKELT